MAQPSTKATITVLIVDEQAGAAGRVAAALSDRLPGVNVVTAASRLGERPTDEPDLIVWNLLDDSPERIGALGLFLQAQPEAPTVVLVPEYSAGLVSVAIQAGAEDAVVRTAGFAEQLAAVVMKHAVLIGAPERDDVLEGEARQGLGSADRSRAAMPRSRPRPDGPGGVPAAEWRRVREAIADLQRENRSLREMVSHLRNAANTDPLTGLGNARHLRSRLEEMFAASRRYGAELSCLVLDLDGLKAVNDTLGHGAGDELLRATAEVIGRCTRKSDVAARVGGDEFVILLPHTDAAMATLLARRLQRALGVRTEAVSELLEPRFATGEHGALRLAEAVAEQDGRGKGPIGACIGVASTADAGIGSAGELIVMADRAMYEAKRRGKGQIARLDAFGPPRARAA